ncbi:MAG: DUF4340 domain-containing protein [bacterium]|nr:DUF4340 domain-containing protein [bacterium]
MSLSKFILLLLLAGALFLGVFYGNTPKNEQELSLPQLTADDYEEIEVIHAQGGFALRRTEEGWGLKEPKNAPVDAQLVQRILINLFMLQAERIVGEGDMDDDVNFGLAPAELDVLYRGAGKSERLSLGYYNPVTKRRYARFESQGDIFLVEEGVYSLLKKTSNDLRDHTPFSLPAEKISRLKLESQAGVLEFERRKAGCFMRRRDRWLPCEDSVLLGVVSQLAGLEVKQFVDGYSTTLAAFGLLPAKIKLTLSVEGISRVMSFGLGVGERAGQGEGLYGKNDEDIWIYQLTGRIPAELLNDGVDFISRDISVLIANLSLVKTDAVLLPGISPALTVLDLSEGGENRCTSARLLAELDICQSHWRVYSGELGVVSEQTNDDAPLCLMFSEENSKQRLSLLLRRSDLPVLESAIDRFKKKPVGGDKCSSS